VLKRKKEMIEVKKGGPHITRRRFLKSTGGALALTSLGSSSLIDLAQGAESEKSGEVKMIPKRVLGKTGEELSIIGFGGIIVSGEEQPDANSFVSEAIDRGINYFDVAPTYGDAEEHLGPALEPYRKDVFLACKTQKRDKEGATAELKESLKKLRTDYFDLYQLHAMTKMEDVEKVMGPGGAMEAFSEAKEQGLIRYLGFSAHSVEAALALMDEFDFDTILFPFNWVCYFNGNFGPQVIKKAKENGMGILALKAMARTTIKEGDEKKFKKCWYHPVTDPEETNLAVRFTLSEPVAAAIPPGDIRLFRQAMDIAADFEPLTDAERDILKDKAEELDPLFRFVS